VWGGSFHDLPVFADVSVNMAMEIKKPATIFIGTEDFGVPSEKQLKDGVYKVLTALLEDKSVYVGCMYGLGRTGTFLSALVKTTSATNKILGVKDGVENPVKYVRAKYRPFAVESMKQEQLIAGMDVSWLAKKLAFKLDAKSVLDKRFWVRYT
jgi:protein-tyrosine phosphatase